MWPFLCRARGFEPEIYDWIRVAGSQLPRRYRGDIALVTGRATETRDVQIVLVPRIDLFTRKTNVATTKQGKHRGTIVPQRGLFNNTVIQASFPKERLHVVSHTEIMEGSQVVEEAFVKFRGDIYRKGLLELDIRHPFVHAIPTREEIQLFSVAALDPVLFIAEQLRRLEHQQLKVGDDIKIVRGELKGVAGFVVAVEGEEIEVLTLLEKLRLSLPRSSVRRALRIGDHVEVHSGDHKDFVGFIASVLGEDLVVINPKFEKQEVSSATYIETSSHSDSQVHVKSQYVDFVCPKVQLVKKPDLRDRLQVEKGDVLKELRNQNPNARFIGRQVKVIGQSAFKGYEGTIRATAKDNRVVVALSNHKLEELSLTQLTAL